MSRADWQQQGDRHQIGAAVDGLPLLHMDANDLTKVLGITAVATERLHQEGDACLMLGNQLQHDLVCVKPIDNAHIKRLSQTTNSLVIHDKRTTSNKSHKLFCESIHFIQLRNPPLIYLQRMSPLRKHPQYLQNIVLFSKNLVCTYTYFYIIPILNFEIQKIRTPPEMLPSS